MAFFGMRCPQCRSRELGKRRREGVRYQEIINDTGLRIGEYRYYGIRCYECRFEFYCQERHHFDEPDKKIQKRIVSEQEFLKAKTTKPGTERIGSTASEFTLMIAAGADHPYALRYLELTKGGNRNEHKSSEGFDLFAGKVPPRD